jgi:hypothetical protein
MPASDIEGRMTRTRSLLPAVVRRLTPGTLPHRVFDRVERMLLRRSAPLEPFEEAGAVLVRLGGKLVVSQPVDALWPDEAQRANLDLVVAACEQLGAEYFLVSHDRRGLTRVGVVAEVRSRFLAEIVDRGQSDPVYVRRTRPTGQPELAANLDAEQMEAQSGLQVWLSRHDPVTGRSYGVGHACPGEFWEELPDGRLAAPAPNQRAAQVTPQERASGVEIEVLGRRYPSIPPFDLAGPFEVTFPVDIVYLWVDGADPAWRARRNDRLASLGRKPMDGAAVASRFREQDELRYSLRSVERFAPWVRHVYLVTDDQQPDWLAEDHPGLTIVDHRDILPAEALPTYNSHAISARVHHIDGLSEHFLLMNDDVLLGRPVGPEDFFHANGITKFFLSRSPIPSGPIAADDLPHFAARKRVRDLIEQTYGFRPFQTFKHTPVPMSRSLLTHLEERFAEPYQRTVTAPFRSPEDLVPSWLHHYAGFAEGRALPGDINYDYFNLTSRKAFKRLSSLVDRRSVECLCINDDEGGDLDLELRTEMLAAFLEVLLPEASSFEDATRPALDRRQQLTAFRTGIGRL